MNPKETCVSVLSSSFGESAVLNFALPVKTGAKIEEGKWAKAPRTEKGVAQEEEVGPILVPVLLQGADVRPPRGDCGIIYWSCGERRSEKNSK
jgi:hypothetical protein